MKSQGKKAKDLNIWLPGNGELLGTRMYSAQSESYPPAFQAFGPRFSTWTKKGTVDKNCQNSDLIGPNYSLFLPHLLE